MDCFSHQPVHSRSGRAHPAARHTLLDCRAQDKHLLADPTFEVKQLLPQQVAKYTCPAAPTTQHSKPAQPQPQPQPHLSPNSPQPGTTQKAASTLSSIWLATTRTRGKRLQMRCTPSGAAMMHSRMIFSSNTPRASSTWGREGEGASHQGDG